MSRYVVWMACVCVICLACNKPSARLNAPPHGTPYETSDLQGTFVYMADNALLADMTVTDIHFLPHRAALSTLGKQRLSRLVSLIEVHGGTIRFNSDIDDEELTQKRTDTILAFLAEAGVDTSGQVLVEDLPGGRGMDASEVILIKVFEASYQPEATGGAGAGPSAASGGT
jgi:hypothetical protein